MALHNLDREGSGDNPAVNAHDNATGSRMAHGTSSIQPVTDATTDTSYIQTKHGRILVNDGINYRAIFGILPDGTVGFIVSKVGYDVYIDVLGVNRP